VIFYNLYLTDKEKVTVINLGVYVDNYLITETCSVEEGGGGVGWEIVELYSELSCFLL
jgi:hypothetical protein